MPMNPAVFLGLGAIALLAMMGKRKKKNGLKTVPAQTVPPPGDDDEAPPFKKIPATPVEPMPENVIAVLEAYKLPPGYSLPTGLTEDDWRKTLWVSEDCEAWAMGKDFKKEAIDPFLPEFYGAYVDNTMNDDPVLAVVPPGEWVEYQFEVQGKSTAIDTPVTAAVVQTLATIYNGAIKGCADTIPSVSHFASREDYLAGMAEYAQENTNFYTLFYNLYQYAGPIMEAIWEDRFPEEAQEWHERQWAAQAVEQTGLNLEDKTDWAYHHAYPDECPEVIDPNNPEHDECKEAWLRLRDYITELLQ
jgi:hypothetical protein